MPETSNSFLCKGSEFNGACTSFQHCVATTPLPSPQVIGQVAFLLRIQILGLFGLRECLDNTEHVLPGAQVSRQVTDLLAHSSGGISQLRGLSNIFSKLKTSVTFKRWALLYFVLITETTPYCHWTSPSRSIKGLRVLSKLTLSFGTQATLK